MALASPRPLRFVSNNHNKFPNGYIIELTKDEKNELVKNFDRFNRLKHSTVSPKIFTEKGLYMLATILTGEQQELVLRSNELLEKVIDIEPVRKLKDDETEIETKIELNLGFVKVSRVVKVKKNNGEEK